MYSFIAITAHYIIKDKNGSYQLRHSLIGFEYLPGLHSGDRIAHTLFGIYLHLGITHQVSTKSPIVCYLTLFPAWCNYHGQCFIKWYCNEHTTVAIGRQRHYLPKRYSPDSVSISCVSKLTYLTLPQLFSTHHQPCCWGCYCCAQETQ